MNLQDLDGMRNVSQGQLTVRDAIAEVGLEVVGGPTDDSFDHEYGTERRTGFEIEECDDVTVTIPIADLEGAAVPLFVAVDHENPGMDTERCPVYIQRDPMNQPWEATIILRLKSCEYRTDRMGSPESVALTYEFSGYYRQDG